MQETTLNSEEVNDMLEDFNSVYSLIEEERDAVISAVQLLSDMVEDLDSSFAYLKHDTDFNIEDYLKDNFGSDDYRDIRNELLQEVLGWVKI